MLRIKISCRNAENSATCRPSVSFDARKVGGRIGIFHRSVIHLVATFVSTWSHQLTLLSELSMILFDRNGAPIEITQAVKAAAVDAYQKFADDAERARFDAGDPTLDCRDALEAAVADAGSGGVVERWATAL